MIKKNPTFFSTRIKKGFALFPVTAGDYTVQFQPYEVVQRYDTLSEKWINDYFTIATFGDWRSI